MTEKTPRVGVGAFLLNEQGELLLQVRKRPPEVGHWSIPGGKVDFGERLAETLVREVREELGVEVAVGELLCVTDHIVPADDAHWVAPTYLVHIVAGEPVNQEPEKIGEVRWFRLDALPAPLTTTTRAAVAAYRGRTGGPSASADRGSTALDSV